MALGTGTTGWKFGMARSGQTIVSQMACRSGELSDSAGSSPPFWIAQEEIARNGGDPAGNTPGRSGFLVAIQRNLRQLQVPRVCFFHLPQRTVTNRDFEVRSLLLHRQNDPNIWPPTALQTPLIFRPS